MVNFTNTDIGGGAEQIEETLYGTETSDECKVILEMYGLDEGLQQMVINEANIKFDGIKIMTDTALEIEFTNKRAPFKEIKNLAFYAENLLANQIAGRPLSDIELKQRIDSGDIRGLIQDIGPEAGFEAMRKFEAYLKPVDDVLKAQAKQNRASIVFELQYDVPRRADLRDTVRDMKELVEDGLMGSIGRVEMLEDRDAIIVIPLRTAVDIDEYDMMGFEIEGMAERVVEDMMGQEIGESARLNRAIVTCTESL